MQKIFVKELKEGMTVDSVFLCAHKALMYGKNNKAYLNVKLLDNSGLVEARVWDQAELLATSFEKNDFVQVKGRIVSYQDHLQFNIFEISPVPLENLSVGDFLPTSQKDIPQMYGELLQICREDMQNPWIHRLMLSILEDPAIAPDLQRAPAAKTNHHAWVGGLLEHILGLCQLAKDVLKHYPQINLDLVLAGMILHDLGKIEEIRADRSFEYTSKGQLVGHLIIGVEIMVRKAAEIPDFPPKILGHLQHIVLAHHGRLEYGSPKLPMTLEALVVHHLDDMDSKIQGFCDIVNREGISDSAWTAMTPLFARPLYKNTQADLEESLRNAKTESSAPRKSKESKSSPKPPSHKKPLTSNLGEILQQSLEEKP